MSGKVLLWKTNNHVSTSIAWTRVRAIHEAQGLTVHDHSTWTTTLDDYGLIYFALPTSDPSWWSEISGDTWVGRLVMTGETSGLLATANTYINTKSALTGITITDDTIDTGCGNGDGTVEADDLMDGLTVLKYGGTSKVSGGTTLSKTETGDHPWNARNRIGNVEFVISGDGNHINDSCVNPAFGVFPNNDTYIQNLWTAPLA